MDWKKLTLHSILKVSKEKLIFIFCAGLLLFILAVPSDSSSLTGRMEEADAAVSSGMETVTSEKIQNSPYEAALETRICEILTGVEGVGQVEVMVVLKSLSAERDFDHAFSSSAAEKEQYPELSGIIISADGGGSTLVKTEISEAMEALFDLPAHKIKVLKRVEKESEE